MNDPAPARDVLEFVQVVRREDFVRYVRWMMWNYDDRRRFRILYLAAALSCLILATCVAVAAGASLFNRLLPGALFVMVAALAAWQWFVRVPNALWKKFQVNAHKVYRFTDGGVEISNEHERSTLAWTAFDRYIETSAQYILVPNSGYNIIISKVTAPAELSRPLGELLARKLPLKTTLH